MIGDATNAILIPVRFIVTIGHLLAISMVYQTLNNNIRTSLFSQNSFNKAQHSFPYSMNTDTNDFRELKQSATAAVTLAGVCFAIDMLGLFAGISIFSKRNNCFQSVVHFIGSVLTCWYTCECINHTFDMAASHLH